VELTREELLQRLKITSRELEEWTENELLSSLPGTAGLFPESALDEGELIKKFSLLGYAIPEIQKIKKSVGLPVRDEKGLIAPHRRTEGGFRLYRPGGVVLLTFIKDLQAFNYTLAEIGTILKLAGSDLGVTDTDLAEMSLPQLERDEGALQFLIEHMREVREASSRVETVFARRLRAVSRLLKARKRGHVP